MTNYHEDYHRSLALWHVKMVVYHIRKTYSKDKIILIPEKPHGNKHNHSNRKIT